MNGVTKILSLMNFQDSYTVSTRKQLFLNELNWLKSKTGAFPADALFIPYAYAGADYTTYFREVEFILSQAPIRLIDISSGDPATLIGAANMFVVGGGDFATFKTKMDRLITPAFNPYSAIKKRVESAVPYLGWNEGSAVASPFYFTPPSNPVATGTAASPYQIINNYTNNQQNRDTIKIFLLSNLNVKKVICQVAKVKEDKSAVRLEESGGGILDSGTEPFPTVIRYKIVGGQLIES